MNKITPEHLSRDAYVYVRQSTPDQLLNNPESRRRHYALETRARSLGWENVIVIDDDLGRSGGGVNATASQTPFTSVRRQSRASEAPNDCATSVSIPSSSPVPEIAIG